MRPDYSSQADPAKPLKCGVPISPNKPEEACRREEGRRLPSQATIHIQPTRQQPPGREQGSFSRSYPSPGRHVFSAGQSV